MQPSISPETDFQRYSKRTEASESHIPLRGILPSRLSVLCFAAYLPEMRKDNEYFKVEMYSTLEMKKMSRKNPLCVSPGIEVQCPVYMGIIAKLANFQFED